MIEFVAPTDELVKSIADDMRQADIDEVWASDHLSPIDALMNSWRMSECTTVATCKGEALVMFGLVKPTLLSDTGVIWMLGANKSLKYRREFLLKTPLVLDEMMTICPKLCNMVHSKHHESIRWLKWLGFTIEEPEVHGPENELFHRFYIERV